MQVQEDEEWEEWVRQAFKSLDTNQDGVICEDDMRMSSVDLDEVMALEALFQLSIIAYRANALAGSLRCQPLYFVTSQFAASSSVSMVSAQHGIEVCRMFRKQCSIMVTSIVMITF